MTTNDKLQEFTFLYIFVKFACFTPCSQAIRHQKEIPGRNVLYIIYYMIFCPALKVDL